MHKLYNEADFTEPSDDCPHPEYWHSADVEATEAEVIEFIAAFMRALQPELVVETGTYKGDMASAIGSALKRNGHGRLITFEVDAALHAVAVKRCRKLPVDLKLGSSLEWAPQEKIDFCWLDSGLDTRIKEFNRYYAMLKGGFVAIHDTAPHHQVRALVQEHLSDRISPLWLPTPRGVMLAQVL